MTKLIKLHISRKDNPKKDNKAILVPIADIIKVNVASQKESDLLGANSKLYYARSAWIGCDEILVRETLDEIMSMVNDLEGMA